MTNCHQLKMKAADGKRRLTDVANTEQLLRIIQSIPSKKAEPFKMWLAMVGRERIEEIIDPELTIERALDTYAQKGYPPEWINITMHNVSRTVTDSAAVQNHHQLRVFCAKLQVFHSFPPRSGSLLQLQTEIAALIPAPQRLCPVPEQLLVPGNPFPSFYGMSQSSRSVSLCSFIISTNTTAF